MKKLLFVFFLLFTFAAKSQDSTYVQLELKNGKLIKGQLIQKSDAEVTVATQDLGKVTLAWSTIKSMNMISKDGNDRTPNPHPSRYFFAPSAIPLKKGEKYYQNALFLVNSFQVGLNDHFSIGGGLVIPFALFITPKIGYQVSEKVHVGGGILFATSLIRGLNFGVGTGYGSVTYGTKEHNLTLNAGLGAYNENTGFGRDDYNWKFAKNPLFTFSGMTRISNRIMLITENWFFSTTTYNYDQNNVVINSNSEYKAILSGGARILMERSAFDVGFLTPTFGDGTGAIPYVAYNIKF
jgi:hypothetical protein